MGALILAASPWLFFGAVNGADLASSEYARARGAVELNPIIGSSRARSIAVKAAATGLEAYVDRKLPRKGRWLWRGAIAGVTGYAVVHNMRVHR